MPANVKLKKLRDQVIVITGASSGIGLSTARMAARHGARVVAAARNEDALRQLEQEVRREGGEAVAVRCDVGNQSDVRHVADVARERFGGFDTWVNNAGVSVYGKLMEVRMEDFRRLFETNFWGVVYGSIVAAEHLRDRGGAIVNVGSVVSRRSIPLQGMYSASKHAVKGFTDALRMELERDEAPVSVTLIKPTSIDTPFIRHAKSYLPPDRHPSVPPPVYAPQTVARAILHAAAHPTRDLFVGGASKTFDWMEKLFPRVGDRMLEAAGFAMQQTSELPPEHHSEGLHEPGVGMEERGGYPGHVARSSLYTQATMHPWVTGAVLGAAGVAVAGVLAANARERERESSSWW